MPKKTDISSPYQQDPISQIPRGSLVQDTFGWTVPVEQVPLPSGGTIYPVSSPLHGRDVLQIKAMTAQEEDILLSRALIKEGTVLTHLIKSCLIDKSIDPSEMLTGDRNALLVSIRITGYGSDYRANVICPACSRSDLHVFDLAGIEIKRIGAAPVSPGTNEFSFSLPVTKKQVTFKLVTNGDEEESARTKERMLKLFPDAKIEGVVTRQLENQILSIEGRRDRLAMGAFIKSMPAADSRALRSYMASIEPGLNMQVDMNCRACGVESKVALPMGAAFFWPE
jgi:hypothetical protein